MTTDDEGLLLTVAKAIRATEAGEPGDADWALLHPEDRRIFMRQARAALAVVRAHDAATAAPVGACGCEGRSMAECVCSPTCACHATAPASVPPAPVTTPGERTCNRHNDCDAADVRAKEAGRRASHCHNENCEDCFGS